MFPTAWQHSIETSERSTVQSLIGNHFPLVLRILHPATDDEGGEHRWSEIAAARGVSFDPATSSWFDTSGTPLGRFNALKGIELTPPEAGLAASTMVRLGRHLPGTESSMVGYVEHRGPAVFEGPGCLGAVTLRGTRFAVYENDRLLRHPIFGQVNPNLWWSEVYAWMCVSDDDLACSYLGADSHCVLAVRSDTDLETVLVDPTAPFHEQAARE
jgi:hypothetical protein